MYINTFKVPVLTKASGIVFKGNTIIKTDIDRHMPSLTDQRQQSTKETFENARFAVTKSVHQCVCVCVCMSHGIVHMTKQNHLLNSNTTTTILATAMLRHTPTQTHTHKYTTNTRIHTKRSILLSSAYSFVCMSPLLLLWLGARLAATTNVT